MGDTTLINDKWQPLWLPMSEDDNYERSICTPVISQGADNLLCLR